MQYSYFGKLICAEQLSDLYAFSVLSDPITKNFIIGVSCHCTCILELALVFISYTLELYTF